MDRTVTTISMSCDSFFLAARVMSAGIPELVKLLRSQGKQVFLVSGGFRQVIHPLATSLDIPLSHVFANTILFKVHLEYPTQMSRTVFSALGRTFQNILQHSGAQEDGTYAGFDESEFTCRR